MVQFLQGRFQTQKVLLVPRASLHEARPTQGPSGLGSTLWVCPVPAVTAPEALTLGQMPGTSGPSRKHGTQSPGH